MFNREFELPFVPTVFAVFGALVLAMSVLVTEPIQKENIYWIHPDGTKVQLHPDGTKVQPSIPPQ